MTVNSSTSDATHEKAEPWQDLWLGAVHGRERIHDCQLGQFQSIVTIGLSLGVVPGPGLVIGAADNRFELLLVTQIVDPARRSAGFHHDQVNVFEAEQMFDVIPPSPDRLEAIFTSRRIVEAADGVELAEVQGKDHHETFRGLGCHLVEANDCDVSQENDHGLVSGISSRLASNHGLHGFFRRLT